MGNKISTFVWNTFPNILLSSHGTILLCELCNWYQVEDLKEKKRPPLTKDEKFTSLLKAPLVTLGFGRPKRPKINEEPFVVLHYLAIRTQWHLERRIIWTLGKKWNNICNFISSSSGILCSHDFTVNVILSCHTIRPMRSIYGRKWHSRSFYPNNWRTEKCNKSSKSSWIFSSLRFIPSMHGCSLCLDSWVLSRGLIFTNGCRQKEKALFFLDMSNRESNLV